MKHRKVSKRLTKLLFVALLSLMALAPLLGSVKAYEDAYTVTISGLPTEIMNRGEEVSFLVTVLICGDPVTEANVTFNDPKGGKVVNSAIDNGDGTYSITYTIAEDDTVGTWYITANATKCTTYTGESSGLDTVEISATYTIYDIVSPTVGSVKNRGQTVDFDFKVKDASDDPVSGLTNLDLDGISVPISEDDAGHYYGSYTILSTDATGVYDGSVSKSGNTGTQSGWLIISDVLLVDVSTDDVEYMRTETVIIEADVDYQDGSPVLGAVVNSTGRDGSTYIVLLDDGVGPDSTADDGIYTGTYKLKKDDDVGTWTIVVDASKDGNSGSGSEDVEVIGALLDVVFASLTPNSVERTMEVLVTFNIYYPDGITELTEGTISVTVYDASDADVTGDFDVGVPTYSDGVWSLVIDTRMDTPSGAGYRIGISAVSTDGHDVAPEKKSDEFEVGGGLEAGGLFEVTPSILDVVVTSTGSDYTTEKNIFGGLDTVYFVALINYPDGSDFTADNGTATADIWIDLNDNDAIDIGEFVIVTGLSLSYNVEDEWRGSFDLYPPGAIMGAYKIKVYAADDNDNTGVGKDDFNVIPQTVKDPTHGPVGTEVTETGSGYLPFSIIYVYWNIDNHTDFVAVADGFTTEYTLVLPPNMIVFDSETIYINGLETSAYSIDYSSGVVTFDSAPAYGAVITANYQLDLYLGMTVADEYGSFVVTFTVPESYAGEHIVLCTDGLNSAIDIFTVEPQIILSSTKGPPEAWVTVTGTGFAPNTGVYIDAMLAGILWENAYALAFTDAYGSFAKALVMPILNLQMMYLKGAPVSVAPIGIFAYDAAENTDLTFYVAFLLCDGGIIDVDVEVGDIYFPGEVMTVYTLISIDGAPVDVDSFEILMYYENLDPMDISMFAPVIRVEPGLYALTMTLPLDFDPGNYLFKVKASTSTHYTWHLTHIELWEIWWNEWREWFFLRGLPSEWLDEWYEYGLEWWLEGGLEATINGVGIDGFTVSPTLAAMGATLMRIDGTIATVVVPGMGQIQLVVDAIHAEIIKVEGDIVTIKTDIAEIKGKIVDVEGDIATIETDIGTISLQLPQMARATSMYMPIGLILLVFAAIAAVASCVLISRKIV